MVGGSDKDHVWWEPVDLKQQRGNNSLDLASLVLVGPLLRDGVQFIGLSSCIG